MGIKLLILGGLLRRKLLDSICLDVEKGRGGLMSSVGLKYLIRKKDDGNKIAGIVDR